VRKVKGRNAELDDLDPFREHRWATQNSNSALCTKCLVVALAKCSLSVTANVRTKGRRPLVLASDIVTKLSASHRGLRTSEEVDLWPLRAMSIAVQFDELLGEGRFMYWIRDERGLQRYMGFRDCAAGSTRRGRRLADAGRIDDPEHFIDAGFDEMVSMLSGSA
jgi:hypothetical protein